MGVFLGVGPPLSLFYYTGVLACLEYLSERIACNEGIFKHYAKVHSCLYNLVVFTA